MARGESLFRQWKLLQTLQQSRYGMDLDELASRMETSRRTVQRDIAALSELFPMACEARDFGRKFWRLTSPVATGERLPMTLTEMISLYLSQQLLAPLAGTPFGEGLDTALQKIKTLLPTRALDYFRDMDGALLVKPMVHEDYGPRSAEISALNDAIIHHRVVRVTYHSASQARDVTSELHPYGIVMLASSLYCVGYLAEYDEVRTLKITRLREVSPTGESFEKPPTFSLDKHTRGSFGVFGPGRVETIRVRLTGWAATNLRENSWHPSQTITGDEGDAVTVEFELSSTVEFKRWLLGFGRHARVLSPASLAAEVRDELQESLAEYRESGTG